MKIMLILNFRYILKCIKSVMICLNIITKGLSICCKNILYLFYLVIFTIIAMVCFVYFFDLFYSVFTCFVGAIIMGFVFVMKIYSNCMGKFTQSKFAFILFKDDWVNVHMVGIAKFIVIYFINIKTSAAWDPKTLFIFLTIFYAVLLIICSDFFIQKMFNIQQGVFTIVKGLEHWNRDSVDGKDRVADNNNNNSKYDNNRKDVNCGNINSWAGNINDLNVNNNFVKNVGLYLSVSKDFVAPLNKSVKLNTIGNSLLGKNW